MPYGKALLVIKSMTAKTLQHTEAHNKEYISM